VNSPDGARPDIGAGARTWSQIKGKAADPPVEAA